MMCAAWSGAGIGSVRRDKAGAVAGEDSTGVAAAHGDLSGRGVEAVKGWSVIGASAPVLVPVAIGRLGRDDGGTSAPDIGRCLVIGQRRRPGTMQVPFRAPSQQTDEQAHAHSAFLAVVARGLASTGILRDGEPGQALFVEKPQLQRLVFDQSAGLHRSQRTHPPESRVTLGLYGPDLRQQAPAAVHHSPVESEVSAQIHDLVGEVVRVGGFSRIRLERHRTPARGGQDRTDNPGLAALAAAVVSETHQRADPPFVVAAAHVDEHRRAFVQMALGEALFDVWLAYEQPVHRINAGP